MTDHLGHPGRQALIWLISGLCLGAIPHFFYQPVWVMVSFMLMISWRLLHEFRGMAIPSKQHKRLKLFHSLLAFSMFALLFSSYGTTIGRDTGIALLTVMISMKVVEIHSRRDFYVTVFLGYFLVITNFFHSQSFATLALMLLVTVIMTASLLSANLPAGILNNQKRFKLASNMLLQAMPVMLLLFVLFPRIPGPLWGLPQDANQATTGMSDDLEMGKFSSLVQSDEIAFRVKFADTMPPASELYWRGTVLTRSDGRRWTSSRVNAPAPVIESTGQRYDYTLTLEPHNKHWLFALDLPITQAVAENLKSRLNNKGTLLNLKAVNQRIQYQLSSATDYRFNQEMTPDKVYTSLPENAHPRTRQLAQQWHRQAASDQAYINRVLQHFNTDNFAYTLTPPPLPGDSVDQFLFESKRGFCEHYAASFTVLMRSAGIPARIVTGYLGGEQNPIDDTLIVRQRDAHAWSEVWLQNKGWVRIDPTSAVASDRIELGINDLLPAARRAPLLLNRSDVLTDIWQNLRHNWDAFNTAWDLWILSYGPELQKQFLSKLGMHNPDWQKMAFWLIASIALSVSLLMLWLFYRRPQQDEISRLYQLFSNKLAKAGYPRKGSEGPQAYAERVATALPACADEIQRISQLFIQRRYQSEDIDLKQLHALIRQFKP